MNNPVSALIVDDEAHLRAHLRQRLQQVWPELELVGEASHAQMAVQLQAELKPQIIFLDIKMPGQSGLEIAPILAKASIIVFVTAYDAYAIEAFEKGAIDYLLKPLEIDRLQLCCTRLQERLKLDYSYRDLMDQMQMVVSNLVNSGALQNKKYLRWIQAGVGNGLRLINTNEILFFRADEKYTCVRTEQSEYLIRKTLKELEDELDPQHFWRIHRSALVNVNAIAQVSKDERGRHMLGIRGLSEKLEVSRNHTHLFQQM